MSNALGFRTRSWTWREHINHNRWMMTTDLFGFVGPAATINREYPSWCIRIADRDGDVIRQITTHGDEAPKDTAYEALLEACRS